MVCAHVWCVCVRPFVFVGVNVCVFVCMACVYLGVCMFARGWVTDCSICVSGVLYVLSVLCMCVICVCVCVSEGVGVCESAFCVYVCQRVCVGVRAGVCASP